MAKATSKKQNVNVQEAPAEVQAENAVAQSVEPQEAFDAEKAEKVKKLREKVKDILEEDKAASLEKLKTLVASYNDCADFNEYQRMKKLDEKMQEVLAKYVSLCEGESFSELRGAENPMVEAATRLYFDTVKLRDMKQDDGSTRRVVVETRKPIDPLRLHKAINGGIGADKLWWSRVERLNTLLIAAAAEKLNAISTDGKKIDVTKIMDTAAMREESKKLKLHSDGDPNNIELFTNDVQETVDAMLGKGYTVTPNMVDFLRRAHEKTGKDMMTLTCTTHKTMRQCMMAVCHSAITGEDFVLDYKKVKKQ